MTDPQRAHQDLLAAQEDLQTAQRRVNACREQLDASLANHGWPPLLTTADGHSIYGTPTGEAQPLGVVLQRLGVGAITG